MDLYEKTIRGYKPKYAPSFEGPYKIIQVNSDNTMVISKHGVMHKVNWNKVLPWKGFRSIFMGTSPRVTCLRAHSSCRERPVGICAKTI